MIFDPIRLVARPKKSGVATHFGVQFPNGNVYDYTIDQGFRQISWTHFADGEAVTVVREIPWQQSHLVRGRLEELMRNPRKYDLVSWNCETFALWLTTGEAKSDQVLGWLVLIGAVFAVAIAARS